MGKHKKPKPFARACYTVIPRIVQEAFLQSRQNALLIVFLCSFALTFSRVSAKILAEFTDTANNRVAMHSHIAYLSTEKKARHVGVRVVEPPADTRQAVRGCLYVVIEAPAEPALPPELVERALSVIQRTYYTVKGSQSYVLTAALREAIAVFAAVLPPGTVGGAATTPSPGIMLVTRLGAKLIALGSGPALALLTAGGNVDLYPSAAGKPGVVDQSTEPEIPELYRQELTNGGAFLLAGQRCLQHFTVRELASIVAYINEGNVEDVAAALRTQAGPDALTGLIAVLTPPPEEPPAAAPAPAAGSLLSRARWRGLPAAVQTPLPARGVDPSPAGRADTPPASPEYSAPLSSLPEEDEDLSAPAPAREVAPTPRSAPTAPWSPTAMAPAVAALQQGWQQLRTMFTNVLPDRSRSRPTQPFPPTPYPQSELADPELYGDSAEHQSLARTPAAPLGEPYKPPARAIGRRARLLILVALLIFILVPVVVAGVFWTVDKRNVDEANRILTMAEASLLSAENALEAEDKATARLKLGEAQAFIGEANQLVGTRLPRADELNVRIERELADLLQIVPLQMLALPLVKFPAEAQPQRVVVADQDLYVLDTGRQLIQFFELDPTENMVIDPEGEVIISQGDVIDGVTVGRLLDIAWLPPIAGVEDKPYLLVLDQNRHLFRYDRRVEGRSLLPLGGSEELKNPVLIRVYADRLYLADAGANQLYRYGRGDFNSAPEKWFGAQTQTNLTSVRSMAIDGDIWMLYAEGILVRYSLGSPVQFSLENSVGAIGEPADLAVGDQGNSMIYIADSSEDRILVYRKDGSYQRQLRAPEGDALRNLRGLFVDEVGGNIYILTQAYLFKHPLTN